MKKTFLTLVTLFALSVLILSACASGGTASASPTGEWTLISYGAASNPTPALPDIETSISFNKDGKFGGSVGCNSFGSDYKVDGDQIIFGSIVSTMMFCEGISEQESAVLSILTDKTINYKINGNQLTLTSADGALIVVLARK
jgi:heat shock protein HslJ